MTKIISNKSVYLSPSTQEKNIGVNNYGTEEQKMNEVADVVERILKQHGIVVYRNKLNMTIPQLVADSNDKEVDIHFSIHSNASDGKSRGSEIFCYRFGSEGERLARFAYELLSPLTPTEDRGVKEGFNFYGTKKHMYEVAYTNAVATLVEVAFHDCAEDAEWIMSNIELIGTALAKGILKYFDIPFEETNTNIRSDINLLHKLGIINVPEYWNENAVKGKMVLGEYAAILIKRVVAFLNDRR